MQDNSTTIGVYETALTYIRAGWAVIPVHGVIDGGHCTCGRRPCDRDNRTAGKHPVKGGWTQGPSMSLPDAYAIWMEDGPGWNIGIRTGNISGFFALDVEADGIKELEQIEADHGKLPRTRVHGTGAGGRHYLFKMPGFDIRNNAKKLADHIDIRGNGGMIVAPPSTSGKGPYGVIDDSPIAEAPLWLLEWLRVRESGKPRDIQDMPVIEDLPQYADLDPADQGRCQRYAEAGIAAEAAKYERARPGAGNAALYEAACAMLEISQSPWNLISTNDVADTLNAARLRRLAWRGDGGQDHEEFVKTFRSAQNQVVGQGRPMPISRSEGVMFDPPVSTTTPGAGNSDPFGQPAGFDSDDAEDGEQEVGSPLDPVDLILASMVDRDGLDSLPLPKPLIHDVLDMESEAWLVAPPGGFKSFVALDWAAHIGLGLPWRGKKVHKGSCVYIVGEGSKGIRMRVQAWEETYGRRMEQVWFLPKPVQVSNQGAWNALIEACRRLGPAMVVIDTQARVTVGMEENSVKEMGILTDSVKRLKEATGGCVVVVHHTNKEGGTRGSSAIIGAQDTEIRVERPEKKSERLALTAKITTGKQKDMSEDESFNIQMKVVQLGTDPETGRVLSSLALVPYDPFTQPLKRPEPEHRANLTANQADLLEALREHADHEGGATAAALRVFVKEVTGREITRGACGTALTKLMRDGLIDRVGTRWVLAEYAEG